MCNGTITVMVIYTASAGPGGPITLHPITITPLHITAAHYTLGRGRETLKHEFVVILCSPPWRPRCECPCPSPMHRRHEHASIATMITQGITHWHTQWSFGPLYIYFSPPPSVVSNQCNSPLHHVIPHYTYKSWDPITLQLHYTLQPITRVM